MHYMLNGEFWFLSEKKKSYQNVCSMDNRMKNKNDVYVTESTNEWIENKIIGFCPFYFKKIKNGTTQIWYNCGHILLHCHF